MPNVWGNMMRWMLQVIQIKVMLWFCALLEWCIVFVPFIAIDWFSHIKKLRHAAKKTEEALFSSLIVAIFIIAGAMLIPHYCFFGLLHSLSSPLKQDLWVLDIHRLALRYLMPLLWRNNPNTNQLVYANLQLNHFLDIFSK